MNTPIDPNKINEKLDRIEAGAMIVSEEIGGVKFQTMNEVMEMAKLMALSTVSVPPWLRNNAPDCLGIIIQALQWRMNPYAVAQGSYAVENRGTRSVGYTAQLINSLINLRAPLKGRLRREIIGEGDERRCKVWGTFKGEDQPHEFVSETLGKMREARGRNEKGDVKGSPLWQTQPEVQLMYSATRQWARLNCPEVVSGAYSEDELADAGFTHMKDVTPARPPKLSDRLKAERGGKGKRGFDHEQVKSEIDSANGQRDQAKEPEQHAAEATLAPEAAAAVTDMSVEATVVPEPAPAAEEPKPETPAPTSSLETARDRGRAAKRGGLQRRAIPPEYRAPDHAEEAAAWQSGWDEEAKSADTHQERLALE